MKRTTLPDDLARVQSAIKTILGDSEVSVFLTRSKKRINSPAYIFVFQYAHQQLMKHLNGKPYKLVTYFYTICQRANVITEPIDKIAAFMECDKSNLYRILKHLRDLNIVLKVNGCLYLSPQLAWRGTLSEWQRAINNLKESERVKLPVERSNKVARPDAAVLSINKVQRRIDNA